MTLAPTPRHYKINRCNILTMLLGRFSLFSQVISMILAIILLTVILCSSPPRGHGHSSLLQIKEDYYLIGHAIDRRKASSVLLCAQLCLKRRPTCRSLNYRNSKGNVVCELNDKGIETHGCSSLVPMSGFVFGELVNLTAHYRPTKGEHKTNDSSTESNINLTAPINFTFTTLGALGPTGPRHTYGYQGTTLEGKVTLQNGIQLWKVPSSGSYVIEAWGASGADGHEGSYNQGNIGAGGKGAYMRGTFNFTRGTTLKILVGQRGSTRKIGSPLPGGGGGGSFITSPSDTPFIIAGGGGGGIAKWRIRYVGDPGQITGTGSRHGGSEGTGGKLYAIRSHYRSFEGGAGGGLNEDGESGSFTEGGKSFVIGGEGGRVNYGGDGGFGGGGAAYMYPGAGGGYSGGGVVKDRSDAIAGGGGSFNNGADQEKEKGVKQGDGKVIITLIHSTN